MIKYKNFFHLSILAVFCISINASSYAKEKSQAEYYKEFEEFAKDLKKEQDKRTQIAPPKESLKKPNTSSQEVDIDSLLETYAPNWKSFNTGTPIIKDASNKLKGGNSIPLVFISFSMPETLIKNYIKEAKKYNGVLVLRGLIGNSVTKTIQKLKEIEGISNNSKGQKSNISIVIHPHLFKLYDINLVPTIVVSKNNLGCILKYDDCSDSYEYDKISGSISIEYALEQIADKGSIGIKKIANKIIEGSDEK